METIKKLKVLFYGNSNLRQAFGILFITVLLSNILGLIRNVIIANRVGVTYGTIGPLDNYYAAFTLPDLVYNLVILGALTSVILPMLVALNEKKDQQEFWRTFNLLVSTGLVAILVAVGVLYIIMPSLVSLLFSGFDSDSQQFTVKLSRILLLSPLFFTISQLTTSALQAKRIFMAPALAPIIYNLAIISGALLIPRYGLSILVMGVVIGAAGHFLIQLPVLLREGWRFSFEVNFVNEHVKKVVRLMIPRTIALTSLQLLLVVFYRLASHFQEGSIAIYRLTDDLQLAPVLLLANTLSMAVFPDFARRIARNEQKEFFDLIGKAVRLLIFGFLPVLTFLFIYRREIITLYIALGQSISFDELDLAVRTYSYFLLASLFQGLVYLLARAYFAKGDTLRPALFSVASFTVASLIAVALSSWSNLGVAGLSLSFAVGSLVNALLLWQGLRLPISLIIFDDKRKFNFFWLILGTVFAWAVMVLLQHISWQLKDSLSYGRSLQNAFVIAIGCIGGLLSYIIWTKVFELEQWQLIRRKNFTTT